MSRTIIANILAAHAEAEQHPDAHVELNAVEVLIYGIYETAVGTRGGAVTANDVDSRARIALQAGIPEHEIAAAIQAAEDRAI